MIKAVGMLQNSFIRFLLVGVINTLTGLAVMFAFRYGAGCPYWTSTFLGNAFGAFISFLLNKTFTFRSSNPFFAAAFRFFAVVLLCYFLAYGLGLRVAISVVSAFGISPLRADDIAILMGIGIYTLLNYWGQKIFVFRQKQTP